MSITPKQLCLLDTSAPSLPQSSLLSTPVCALIGPVDTGGAKPNTDTAVTRGLVFYYIPNLAWFAYTPRGYVEAAVNLNNPVITTHYGVL